MMHPIEVPNDRDAGERALEESSPLRAGWWAFIALVIVVALLVTAVSVFS